MEGSDNSEAERVLKVLESLFDKAYNTVLEKHGSCEFSPKFIKDTNYSLVDAEYIALVMASGELSEDQKQAELDEYNRSVYMGIDCGARMGSV